MKRAPVGGRFLAELRGIGVSSKEAAGVLDKRALPLRPPVRFSTPPNTGRPAVDAQCLSAKVN